MKKVIRTPEEVIARKAEVAKQKRDWRKRNPEKQQAILDRYFTKKAREALVRANEEGEAYE